MYLPVCTMSSGKLVKLAARVNTHIYSEIQLKLLECRNGGLGNTLCLLSRGNIPMTAPLTTHVYFKQMLHTVIVFLKPMKK